MKKGNCVQVNTKLEGDMYNKSHSGTFTYICAYSSIFRNIQANFTIFSHIQTWSGISKKYLRTFRALCNPDIVKTLIYSEPQRHIQNPVISRILTYSEPEACSESRQTFMMEGFAKIVIIIVAISAFHVLYFMKYDFF